MGPFRRGGLIAPNKFSKLVIHVFVTFCCLFGEENTVEHIEFGLIYAVSNFARFTLYFTTWFWLLRVYVWLKRWPSQLVNLHDFYFFSFAPSLKSLQVIRCNTFCTLKYEGHLKRHQHLVCLIALIVDCWHIQGFFTNPGEMGNGSHREIKSLYSVVRTTLCLHRVIIMKNNDIQYQMVLHFIIRLYKLMTLWNLISSLCIRDTSWLGLLLPRD